MTIQSRISAVGRRCDGTASTGIFMPSCDAVPTAGAAPAFGATISVVVMHEDEECARTAIAAALRAVREVDSLVSLDDPGSQLARLNRHGVLHQPDARLLALLAQARALSQLTDGAFDITIQPLWAVCRQAALFGGAPSEYDLLQARSLVCWRNICFNRQEVRLLQRGMAVTLDGLAQGYAADLAMAVLRRHGIRNALLDTGELAAAASLSGAAGGESCTASAHGAAFCCVEPEAELCCATVSAPCGLLADGFSTACIAMGAKRAHALVARLPGLDLHTLDRQGKERRTPGFRKPARLAA